MSGGQRYWNDDTQRWEDGPGSGPAATPTLPTPPPVAEGPPVTDPPPAAPAYPAPPTSTPAVRTQQGWPGGGADSTWHGPGAEGTVPEWSSGASWPPVEPLPVPAPGPAGGLNRRLVWSVVVGAAVVGVAVSLVLTLVVGKGGGPGKKPVAAGSVTSSASASPDLSQSPSVEDTGSPSPSVSASAPPAGYELRNDTEGFRIAIPEGWSRDSVDSQYGIAVVSYRSPDREHRLQVYQVAEASPEDSFQLYLSDQTKKPAGFKKLDLQKLDDGEFTGSRLEYLADTIKGEPDVGTWHVYDERFVAADGNIYAIASYGPDSDGRDDELSYLTTALDWFCPPYTTCDADAGID
ncbi:hypothetical protein GCM10022403_056230 [Streptomyces coacervatus]|uniref:Serine/arginine repetitive matrix protein 2 n=1 Tax=Streptomyces coacervatus TaxID=647381 RepID=A0ABP7ID11_9ACTN|nr:hypothetical protein [Streptomyces coacervatus]MDF2269013.1 hypothetical protein [Streptomyces coacervatus]